MIPPILQKLLPVLSFVIASAALGFQVTVLYPWHHQLEKDFSGLSNQQKTKLHEYHEVRMQNIKNIEMYLSKLNLEQYENEVDSREGKM
ncbi:hypothetical protein I4U23_001487 [Adineta vaga]|nr:hypothetical protein I4U23_001487 [Adineta vaga]